MPNVSPATRKPRTRNKAAGLQTGKPLLSMKDVSFRLGGNSILRDINLEGYASEIIALLGPNGAGKTTTMRLLTGNLAPETGTIHICGFCPRKSPVDVARNLGYLPEGAPLWQNRNIIDTLRFTATCHHLHGKVQDDRIIDIVTLLGLESALDKTPEILSKGMRRRVGLALALLPDPPVLVLDEPSDGLDPAQQRILHKALRELSRKKTILISTHNLDEVQELCQKIAILDHGTIVAQFVGNERDNLFKKPDGLLKTYLKLTEVKDRSVPSIVSQSKSSPT